MAAPSIKFHEFAPSGVNPVGERHLQTHSSFIKELGQLAGQFLDFGSVNTTFTKKTTPTKAFIAFSDAFNDANEAIFNMRLWYSDISDFTAGTFDLNGLISGAWISGIATDGLTDASGKFLPTALPSGQNLYRTDGWPEISGINSDSEVTQFVYVSVTADTDVPVGVYGGDAGGFTMRLSIDYR